MPLLTSSELAEILRRSERRDPGVAAMLAALGQSPEEELEFELVRRGLVSALYRGRLGREPERWSRVEGIDRILDDLDAAGETIAVTSSARDGLEYTVILDRRLRELVAVLVFTGDSEELSGPD